MRVYIRGGSVLKRDLAKKVVKYCATRLLEHEPLTVIVNIERLNGIWGDVDFRAEKKGCLPRRFVIRIERNISPVMMIMTICHEMVHLRQWINGDLKEFIDDGVVRWFWMDEDHTNTPVDISPWEKEAYDLEYKLYEEVVENGIIDLDRYKWKHGSYILSKPSADLFRDSFLKNLEKR